MRIQLLDWSYLVGIVQPDVGQSKVASALQVYREASVEAGYARELPSLGIPVGAKEVSKRKIPVVAGHEVMPHVPGGKAIGTVRIAWVPLGSNVIQRLGIGIREQVGEVASATFRRNLQ